MDGNTIRFLIFIAIFCTMLVLEELLPRHPKVDSKSRRMGINLTLTGIDIFAVRLFFGAAAVGAAQYGIEKGWGVFNNTNLPDGVEMFLAVIILDFSIYVQHVLVHLVPLFWRFHMIHHTDLDLDVSSGLRFHPVEILGSMLYKILIVFAIGPTPLTVLVFEAILNGMALFTHSNVKLPETLEFNLRRLIVTPDMHRIHHSIEQEEMISNYGFNLSIWDRLLGTYLKNAQKPQSEIVIGIESHRSPDSLSIKNLLIIPFTSQSVNQICNGQGQNQ